MAEMRLDNARDPEQARRMLELEKNGDCHFCGDVKTKHTSPIIYDELRWFITANDFPYKGSVHHFLIVSKRHITKISDLHMEAQLDLFKAMRWLENYLQTTGGSYFVRSGDMAYTAATLDHLHFHYIVGERKISNEPNKLEDLILAPVGFKKK